MGLRRVLDRRLASLLLACFLNMGKHTEAGREVSRLGVVPKCRRRCGAVDVPFPFGFKDDYPGCFYPEPTNSFVVTCNTTFNPPKPFQGDIEVIDFSIQNAKMRTWQNISYACYNDSGSNDSSTWYSAMSDDTSTFSYSDNIFVAIGCDTRAYLQGLTSSEYVGEIRSTKYTGGCMSSCESLDNVDGSCSGIGCCQISIPKGFRGYEISIGSNHNHTGVLDFNPCSYSFLVEKNNYSFNASDLYQMPKTRRFPIVFDWYVGKQSCELALKNSSNYACISNHSCCINSANGPGYICNCSEGYQGNPYVRGGCQDIDECQDPRTCPSGETCTNIPGNYTCTCPSGTARDPYTRGCVKIQDNKTNVSAALGIGLGISCGFGTLLLMVGAALLRKHNNKKKMQRRRQRCFKNNHDLLLKQLLHCDQSETVADRIKTFSLDDLEKATNKFDGSRIVGDGGHGIVYKGILEDLQVVAIKISKEESKIEKEQFVNEIILLSQISHINVVKLIGCCLESEVPLLVYEFISNGTLAKHLDVSSRENLLPWDDRLRIAAEISSALAYMHTKASVSIYHRDIKSSNILLNDKLTAKVSDFGASKTVSSEQTSVNSFIQGTFGYLDPEYLHTGRLTEKSDVYSLGVILVELITGKTPTSKESTRDDSNVTGEIIGDVENKRMPQAVDASILEEADMEEIEVVVKLAKSCLKMRGIDRPTMKEVEMTLEGLMERKQKRRKNLVTKEPVEDEQMVHQVPLSMDTSIIESISSSITASFDDRSQPSENLAR